VALGGTLHEHIPDIRDEDIHRGRNGGWTLQTVDVDPASNLGMTMKSSRVETFSAHHQAVHFVPKGLSTVAVASDGIIEGLEDQTHPVFVAVQWHPEVSAGTDDTQQLLFDGLVRAAKIKKELVYR
jgi:gamma-glutamyl-gamma-aminobutyrate hydrolase PuuD